MQKTALYDVNFHSVRRSCRTDRCELVNENIASAVSWIGSTKHFNFCTFPANKTFGCISLHRASGAALPLRNEDSCWCAELVAAFVSIAS